MWERLNAIKVIGLFNLLRLRRANLLAWNEILRGYYTTRTLQALFNIGFFDEIKRNGMVDAASFAASKNLDTDILTALCDSLVALDILKKEGIRYVPAKKGRLLADVAYGWFTGTYGYEDVFHNLEALLKKEKEYSKDVTRRLDFRRTRQRRDRKTDLLSTGHRCYYPKEV